VGAGVGVAAVDMARRLPVYHVVLCRVPYDGALVYGGGGGGGGGGGDSGGGSSV